MIDENMKRYESLPHSPEETALMKDWNDFYPKYVQARPRWFQLISEKKTEEAATWRANTTNNFGPKCVKILSRLIELQNGQGESKQSAVSAMLASAHNWLPGMCLFSMILGMSVWFLVSRNISQGLVVSIRSSTTSRSRRIFSR